MQLSWRFIKITGGSAYTKHFFLSGLNEACTEKSSRPLDPSKSSRRTALLAAQKLIFPAMTCRNGHPRTDLWSMSTRARHVIRVDPVGNGNIIPL